MKPTIFLHLIIVCFWNAAASGQNLLDSIPADEADARKWTLESYGSLNFHHFDWQIWPEKRDAVDFERAVVAGSYRFAPKYQLNAELEFEHGGTGVSVEFDRFEEFGEFEYEVEKGGEIRFERFDLQFDFSKKHRVEAGYVKVPFGLLNFRDELGRDTAAGRMSSGTRSQTAIIR